MACFPCLLRALPWHGSWLRLADDGTAPQSPGTRGRFVTSMAVFHPGEPTMNIRTALAALAVVPFVAFAQGAGPTDPQIAHIVVTANQVDIDAGKLAKSKTKSKDVKAFAQQMITDHTAVNQQATDLAGKLKVKP